VGAEDVVTPPAIAAEVAAALPPVARVQAGPAIVPECGHAFYLEKTTRVATLIDDHFGGPEA
jgi:pimeloyl-ACP methyl ester carboxylesterase